MSPCCASCRNVTQEAQRVCRAAEEFLRPGGAVPRGHRGVSQGRAAWNWWGWGWRLGIPTEITWDGMLKGEGGGCWVGNVKMLNQDGGYHPTNMVNVS